MDMFVFITTDTILLLAICIQWLHIMRHGSVHSECSVRMCTPSAHIVLPRTAYYPIITLEICINLERLF